MLEVNDYRPAYSNKVIELILKIQREEFNIPITIDDQPDLRDIGNFYQKDGGFWVALFDGDIAGTIAVKNIGNGNAMIRKMFVKKEYRGQEIGAAAQLISRLFDWAKQKQLGTCYLGTTALFLAAHKFYEKNGFREIGKEELPPNFPIMEVDKKFYSYYL